MQLKRYTVYVRRFHLATGIESGAVFALPVDSPDEEHAISAAMSNAVAFTRKTEGSAVIPVAFTCERIESRA